MTVWLALVAGPDAAQLVAVLGAAATILLVAALTIRRPEPIAVALALLGAAYALILAIDSPALDERAAIVGATLLVVGELAHLSVESRPAATEEAGADATRAAFVALLALIALGLGEAMLALTDLLRTGGFAVEAVGAVAAAGAVGLLVLAAREARRNRVR